MLLACLVMFAIAAWSGSLLIYFRGPLREWFDNRYGPTATPKRKYKPMRRRMYD